MFMSCIQDGVFLFLDALIFIAFLFVGRIFLRLIDPYWFTLLFENHNQTTDDLRGRF